MDDENRHGHVIRVRNFLCVLWLILALFSESYTAISIALDRFVPHRYRILGWLLLVLPCALAVGLLLFYANLKRVGFCLCSTSLLLYVLVTFVDLSQGHAGRGDWIVVGVWLAFCAIGVFAARLLMGRPQPS